MGNTQEEFKDALKFDSREELNRFEGYIIHSNIMYEVEKLRREKNLKESVLEDRLDLKQGEYRALMVGDKRIDIAFINKVQHTFKVRFIPKFEKIDKKTKKGE